MRIKIEVKTPTGTLTFESKVHISESLEGRAIEEEYYRKWRGDKSVPKGLHHEFELVKWPAITFHTHVHPTTGKRFVCWTGDLPKIEIARNLFRMWCLLEAWGHSYGRDYGTLVQEGQIKEMQLEEVEVFAEGQNIRIESETAT